MAVTVGNGMGVPLGFTIGGTGVLVGTAGTAVAVGGMMAVGAIVGCVVTVAGATVAAAIVGRTVSTAVDVIVGASGVNVLLGTIIVAVGAATVTEGGSGVLLGVIVTIGIVVGGETGIVVAGNRVGGMVGWSGIAAKVAVGNRVGRGGVKVKVGIGVIVAVGVGIGCSRRMTYSPMPTK
ncbi:MAG: hypothetical protein WCL57_01025 [Chloroflexota bacterium]|nr:hypothetical protein [Chloroflexota bacterium]